MAPLDSSIPDAEPVITALAGLVAPNYAFSLDSEEGQAYANAMFAKLKSLNRQAHATVRQYKEETANVRASMDESLLKLQNLLYEKRHLEMEIDKCRQYGYDIFYRLIWSSEFATESPYQVHIPGRRTTHARRVYASSTARSKNSGDP